MATSASGSAAAAEVTTRVKTSKLCRGAGVQHTCRVVPAVMNFTVNFTNSTVALADVADAAAVAVLPPKARNASQQRTDAEAWVRIASTLFPPITVEYQRWNASKATLRFGDQYEGQQNTTGSKQSSSVGQGGLRYLMLLYKEDVEPNSASCELAYRDPMKVSLQNPIYLSFISFPLQVSLWTT